MFVEIQHRDWKVFLFVLYYGINCDYTMPEIFEKWHISTNV